MQAYRDALADENTSFVLSPEGEFFRFFGSSTPDLPQEAPFRHDDVAKGHRIGHARRSLNQALGQIIDQDGADDRVE